MKFKVQVVIESDGGETQLIQEVAQIERVNLQPDNLGLTIAEANFSIISILMRNTFIVLKVFTLLSYNFIH